MALPTSITLSTMDYAFRGQPFVEFPAKDINISTMDYAWRGQPFVRNAYQSASTSVNIDSTAIAITAAVSAVTHTMSGSVSPSAVALTFAIKDIIAGIGPDVSVSSIALSLGYGAHSYSIGINIDLTALELLLALNNCTSGGGDSYFIYENGRIAIYVTGAEVARFS